MPDSPKRVSCPAYFFVADNTVLSRFDLSRPDARIGGTSVTSWPVVIVMSYCGDAFSHTSATRMLCGIADGRLESIAQIRRFWMQTFETFLFVDALPAQTCQSPSQQSAPAHRTLFSILFLRLLHRLPLHIAGAVRPACAQRLDVVHDVARTRATAPAGPRTRMMSHERRPLGGVAQRPGDRLGCEQAANQDKEDTAQHQSNRAFRAKRPAPERSARYRWRAIRAAGRRRSSSPVAWIPPLRFA